MAYRSPISNKLQTDIASTLTDNGWTVHHSTQTDPHILSSDGKFYHNIEVDRYSTKTPEIVVFYFNRRREHSLPKSIQQKWDVTSPYPSGEIKIIVTVQQAHQLLLLAPQILTLMEAKNYQSIRPLLPFKASGNPQYHQRIRTPEVDELLAKLT